MRVSRIFSRTPFGPDQSVRLEGQTAHYLGKVLRLTAGNALTLFNGDGLEYTAVIEAVAKHHVDVRLGSAIQPTTESPLHTVLGLGISRGERMDYAIQKSTELGVSRIAPLFTEHCEVRLNAERQDKRIEHWQQVAISACEQCGRVSVPEVLPPCSLPEFIRQCSEEVKLVFDLGEAATLGGPRPTGGVALLIGPEGGLAPDEIQLARSAGFLGVKLGPRVLRTETAPVAALAVLQHVWG